MNKIKNNKQNIINKFNWKIDSRNKKHFLVSKNSKNTLKCKTKNILCQNDSSLRASFLDAINYIKGSNKNKDIKNISKIIKYVNYNKSYYSNIQRNYSFNNI